jgi:hypothetical protein
MAKPTPGTYPAYFENYIKLVEVDTPQEAIEKYTASLDSFFTAIPSAKHLYKYAEEKWTVKEMLQHIIDTERIFAYRALSIARKDKTPLPGFDENAYAIAAANTNHRSWDSLIDEFKAVRKSTDLLLQSFNEEQLQQNGTTNERPNTVNAIGFIIFGHIIHHKKILEERYLSK